MNLPVVRYLMTKAPMRPAIAQQRSISTPTVCKRRPNTHFAALKFHAGGLSLTSSLALNLSGSFFHLPFGRVAVIRTRKEAAPKRARTALAAHSPSARSSVRKAVVKDRPCTSKHPPRSKRRQLSKTFDYSPQHQPGVFTSFSGFTRCIDPPCVGVQLGGPTALTKTLVKVVSTYSILTGKY